MKALYAGSFDPITNGHIDIIRQATKQLKCTVIVGVAKNPDKSYMFRDSDRHALVCASLEECNLENCEVEFYDGMTVEAADRFDADILIRGLRAVMDFDAEFQMTLFNRKLKPCRNTVFLMPDETNFYLSSTAIRGIARMGGDVSEFVPKCVAEAIKGVARK